MFLLLFIYIFLKGAPTVADFPNLERIKNVIFVDSQWHSAKRITSADYVKGIPHIQITQYQTLFWRYQNCGSHCLATIEGNKGRKKKERKKERRKKEERKK